MTININDKFSLTFFLIFNRDTDQGVDEMINFWLPKMHSIIIGPGLNPDNNYVLVCLFVCLLTQ